MIRYAQNTFKLVEETKPLMFLIGATCIGKSLAPRVAAALKTGLTADCVDLDLDEDRNLIQIRPAFSGNIMAEIKTRTKPQMTTVRYKAMKALKKNVSRKGKVIKKKVKVIINTGMKIINKT